MYQDIKLAQKFIFVIRAFVTSPRHGDGYAG